MNRNILLLLSFFFVSNCDSPPTQIHEEANPFEELLKTGNEFDLHLMGGTVIDGTGKKRRMADVLLREDSIVFIGSVDTSNIIIKERINVTGKIVSPGFIDTHSHGDPLKTPDFQNFLAMGVTTISLGQDGSSPAREDLTDWMDQIDEQGMRPNLVMYMGHGTLRNLSGTGAKRIPSKKELERMKELLRNAMEGGCWGMTTGLEYSPGLYAEEAELLELAKVVGENDGILMSHMRNEDDEELKGSIEELLRQGEHCRVQVSHIKSVYGKGAARGEEILSWLNAARKRGITISADIYPYSASYTTIGIIFPDWARPPNDFAAVKKTRRKELADHLRKRVLARNGPEATLLGTAPWTGKTLAEVAAEKNRPFEEILIDVIGPSGASAAYFVMDEALQERLIQDSMIMVCSDGSPTGHHPRGHGTFSKIIEEYVIEKQLFSLEEAIRKMTSLPAKTIGIHNRGKIEAGYKADILIFDPKNIQATATYDHPHQLASGMDYVFVNGKLTFQDGKTRSSRSGKVLRKRAPLLESETPGH